MIMHKNIIFGLLFFLPFSTVYAIEVDDVADVTMQALDNSKPELDAITNEIHLPELNEDMKSKDKKEADKMGENEHEIDRIEHEDHASFEDHKEDVSGAIENEKDDNKEDAKEAEKQEEP